MLTRMGKYQQKKGSQLCQEGFLSVGSTFKYLCYILFITALKVDRQKCFLMLPL